MGDEEVRQKEFDDLLNEVEDLTVQDEKNDDKQRKDKKKV